MSWLSGSLSTIGRILNLNQSVERLEKQFDKIEAEVRIHDRRLVRLETLVEFADPSRRSPFRLPKE